jgi:hypothetical protein
MDLRTKVSLVRRDHPRESPEMLPYNIEINQKLRVRNLNLERMEELASEVGPE